jgi:hypothetical protein
LESAHIIDIAALKGKTSQVTMVGSASNQKMNLFESHRNKLFQNGLRLQSTGIRASSTKRVNLQVKVSRPA